MPRCRRRFTMPVDYTINTSTGISAHDRALTVQALIDPASSPADFIQPGHLFPLRYQPGGVLVRPGHTEAIIDLCRLAGMYPAGVVCEVMKDDGTMARLPDLVELAQKHSLNILTIADLIEHRRQFETVAQEHLPA